VAFGDVVGHSRIIALLARALARDTLPPAVLFAGPQGIGKRRIALAVAEAFNCQKPGSDGDACGKCATCVRIRRGSHPDVIVLEPGDLGSIKIDSVREAIRSTGYRPFEARRRVIIIDNAEALTIDAQDALLKTLEEPPPSTTCILVTSLPDVLLPTVLSRCSIVRFAPLSAQEVARALVRDHDYDEKDARAAAADSDGSVGRALEASTVDVADAREVARKLLALAARVADPSRRLDAARDLVPAKTPVAAERAYLTICLRAMASILRDLGILATQADARLVANADLRDDLQRLSSSFSGARSHRAFSAVDEAIAALDQNVNPKVVTNWLVLQL
jgi:DNA polymerase-3 subunit delta'